MIDLFLALGVLLTTSSQLRNAPLPLGPGELCLAFWIAATLFQAFRSNVLRVTPALSAVSLFWACFALSLSLGTLMALATAEAFDAGLLLHDAIAFPLISASSILSVAMPFAAVRLRRVAWQLAILGSISLLAQWANGLGLFSVSIVDPWFWERFRGWSSNPNQLALLCVVQFLVALFLADSARGPFARLGAVLCLIPPAILGRMSGSDTFSLALLFAITLYGVGKIVLWLRFPAAGAPLRASFARLMLVASPLVLLSLAPLGIALASDAGKFAMGFTKNNGAEAGEEAQLRFALWHQAFARGVESGMLGLGPGPHLQIPPSIAASRIRSAGKISNVINPDQNGTANFEAHNTLFDLFTQGGLLAVLSFTALVAYAAWRAWFARSAGLLAMVGGTMLFGMTGLISRQPIFWFMISLCVTATLPAVPGLRRWGVRESA